ncbi:MAG: hypothetical protein AAFN77_23475 [Planctomycetota bacterium]
MGAYYFYVNETKQQYFRIDPAGFDIKKYALGRNIGSRALSYLILDNSYDSTGVESDPLVGSWIGDTFFVTGDDYCEAFDSIKSTYEDIGQSIIELIVRVNPWDLIEYGGADWLINVIEHAGDPITITPPMRKRLSHEFRHANHQNPSDELRRVISALRVESVERD